MRFVTKSLPELVVLITQGLVELTYQWYATKDFLNLEIEVDGQLHLWISTIQEKRRAHGTQPL
jgi:hypothetical protein